MTKREQGRKAVEAMLSYAIPTAVIGEILGYLSSSAFTNGAYERLIDEQIAERERNAEVKP